MAAGLRDCAATIATPSALRTARREWQSRGLTIERIDHSRAAAPRRDGTHRVTIGLPENIRRYQNAWRAGDVNSLGSLLGYPECCRTAFLHRCVEGCSDHTWLQAAATAVVDHDRAAAESLELGAEVLNMFWKPIGVRPVSHLPCRCDCHESLRISRQSLSLGAHEGYASEMAWLAAILSWPVEWSGLHGLAETLTPIMKILTRTDAAPGRRVIRRDGTAYPSEGATGVRFPYRRRTTAPKSPQH